MTAKARCTKAFSDPKTGHHRCTRHANILADVWSAVEIGRQQHRTSASRTVDRHRRQRPPRHRILRCLDRRQFELCVSRHSSDEQLARFSDDRLPPARWGSIRASPSAARMARLAISYYDKTHHALKFATTRATTGYGPSRRSTRAPMSGNIARYRWTPSRPNREQVCHQLRRHHARLGEIRGAGRQRLDTIFTVGGERWNGRR